MSDVPKQLRLGDQGRMLRVVWAGEAPQALPAEYLRVFSPSAEVQGHGPGEGQLVGGKRDLRITKIEPVGRYAVRLVFSDGHDTGLYTWETLRELAAEQAPRWARYLERLAAQGMSRDPGDNVMPLSALKPKNALKP